MQIERVYSDGSFIKIYETGDIVKIIDPIGWLVEIGELATITSATYEIENDQHYVEIITASMKSGGWAPLYTDVKSVEPAGKTLLQVPYLVQKWKETQVKTLLIGETHAQNG